MSPLKSTCGCSSDQFSAGSDRNCQLNWSLKSSREGTTAGLLHDLCFSMRYWTNVVVLYCFLRIYEFYGLLRLCAAILTGSPL